MLPLYVDHVCEGILGIGVSHGPNLVLEDVNIYFFLFSLHRPIWEMQYISFSLLVAIVK